MRLILTLASPLGTFDLETGGTTVDALGMEGAMALLKERAFARFPSVARADCATRFAFHDASLEGRFGPV